jgi:hypothetical protein
MARLEVSEYEVASSFGCEEQVVGKGEWRVQGEVT